MTAISNTFEGGTDGVTLTTLNTGGASGTAIDSIVRAADGIVAFSNVQARDTLSMRCASRTTASGSYILWLAAHGNLADEFGAVYFLTSGASSQDIRILHLSDSTPTLRCAVQFRTTNVLRLEATGVGNTDFTTALTANTWYRIEWNYTPGTTTFTVRLYLGSSPSLLEQQSRADVTASANCGQVIVGQTLGLANLPSATDFFYFDNFLSGQATWPTTIGLGGPPPPPITMWP